MSGSFYNLYWGDTIGSAGFSQDSVTSLGIVGRLALCSFVATRSSKPAYFGNKVFTESLHVPFFAIIQNISYAQKSLLAFLFTLCTLLINLGQTDILLMLGYTIYWNISSYIEGIFSVLYSALQSRG